MKGGGGSVGRYQEECSEAYPILPPPCIERGRENFNYCELYNLLSDSMESLFALQLGYI